MQCLPIGGALSVLRGGRERVWIRARHSGEYTPDLEPFTEGRKTLKRFGLKSGSTVSSLGCRLFMNCNVNVDCRLHQQHYREERGNSERVAESVGY